MSSRLAEVAPTTVHSNDEVEDADDFPVFDWAMETGIDGTAIQTEGTKPVLRNFTRHDCRTRPKKAFACCLRVLPLSGVLRRKQSVRKIYAWLQAAKATERALNAKLALVESPPWENHCFALFIRVCHGEHGIDLVNLLLPATSNFKTPNLTQQYGSRVFV
jgi:hypothetical protein